MITQTPLEPRKAGQPPDILDQRYPEGSRVVLVRQPYNAKNVQVLSLGLIAAGGPVVSPSGRRIFFAGKASTNSNWQIYEATLHGRQPKAVTAMSGGAMDPTIIASGDLVFSSPVPKVGELWKTCQSPSLFAQSPGGSARRLTFGARGAVEPTVLRDGKILFISAHPAKDTNAPPSLGLFTVSNDGTEVAVFALDHDGAPLVHRPRELLDGRVGFLAEDNNERESHLQAQAVRMARPFLTRAALFAFPTSQCRSVEPDGDGALLACLKTNGLTGRSVCDSFAVYGIEAKAQSLGVPIFDDPVWNDIEAIRVAQRVPPMGHISAMNRTNALGNILCVDVNYTRPTSTQKVARVPAQRIRVLAQGDKGRDQVLGEISLQADGSFLAKVPADIPLGFEALDDHGQVLRRLPPSIWVRRGENRSCLGCHEPYNRSPRNVRPIAISLPPAIFDKSIRPLAPETP